MDTVENLLHTDSRKAATENEATYFKIESLSIACR